MLIPPPPPYLILFLSNITNVMYWLLFTMQG
jgi:hypothetical protein